MTYLPVFKGTRIINQYEPTISINIVTVSVKLHVGSVIIRKRDAQYTSRVGGVVVAS
jgi:hypothetical protein